MPTIRRPPKKDDPLAGDISHLLDPSKFKTVHFNFAPKDSTMTIRLPKAVIDGAKKVAKRRKVKYQALLREAIVAFVVKEGGF